MRQQRLTIPLLIWYVIVNLFTLNFRAARASLAMINVMRAMRAREMHVYNL